MTLVNRLKAAPPHFVPHIKAPAPKIIMRRSSDLGKDRDPGVRCYSPHDQKLTNGGPSLFIAALAELPKPPSSARRACIIRSLQLPRKRLTLTRN